MDLWPINKLYKETAGLDIQLNLVYFISYGRQNVGPGEQFLDFIRACAPSKRGWFRDITLSTRDEGHIRCLDELLESKDIMLALAEFCRQYPQALLRYEVPRSICSDTGAGDAIVQGLFLSLVIRGEDLRSVAAIGSDFGLDLFDDMDWYKDAEGAAKICVSNPRFWVEEPYNLEDFKRQLENSFWPRVGACLQLLTEWSKNGI